MWARQQVQRGSRFKPELYLLGNTIQLIASRECACSSCKTNSC